MTQDTARGRPGPYYTSAHTWFRSGVPSIPACCSPSGRPSQSTSHDGSHGAILPAAAPSLLLLCRQIRFRLRRRNREEEPRLLGIATGTSYAIPQTPSFAVWCLISKAAVEHQVAASVLDTLLAASGSPESAFKVAAVVTQPPAAKNRGRKLMPSAVAQLALDRGFPEGLIFTPERAGEESFLSDLKEVKPDVCVTAAYGNILPQRFLDIPQCGTVNIHPSLLPLYRGAAPVQRALQDGVTETGVSIAYTVRALDAGPVIAFERFSVDECVKVCDISMHQSYLIFCSI
ncbi:hypothetical protein PR202_gb05153 [Eleusine coracana subsp. coracana]|uniref:methionyl-tRNA formyltransferase n=1 Tax=Eleusine coracana subsp. coracana TaxID=191504 RepID=A0AAV5E674_ELECO|nr:hypothetical protein PR202_gb05153 [Eleusine coracana subsp. coracana]